MQNESSRQLQLECKITRCTIRRIVASVAESNKLVEASKEMVRLSREQIKRHKTIINPLNCDSSAAVDPVRQA